MKSSLSKFSFVAYVSGHTHELTVNYNVMKIFPKVLEFHSSSSRV